MLPEEPRILDGKRGRVDQVKLGHRRQLTEDLRHDCSNRVRRGEGKERVGEDNLVVQDERRDQLLHFQQCNVLAQADALTRTKLESLN